MLGDKMDISKFTKEDLEKELKRREEQKNKPFPLTDLETCWELDFSQVKKACEVHIQEIADGKVDTDAEHWIYEAAMEAVYGKDVWDWVNKMQVLLRPVRYRTLETRRL
jgi:hypothetical protein